MAVIKVRNTNEVISGEENVKQFLDQFEVLYEHWDSSKLPKHLEGKFVLTDDDKAEVLNAFDEDIKSLAARRGYVQWDVISLSDATPNIEELLAKFKDIHTHSEDEVRAIAAGNGIFVIKGNEQTGYFDVELEAGDVISVPENTPHFFTLMDNRQVVAVRLFIEPAGWVAKPFHDPAFTE
ncbi:cupin domain-containing protein [Aneurinibacillus sp. Ricciae_BoGa-3]|uniref:1,2-dihydroxy-3-keto-5-methylthiopentene dioxygenase n=1 Tax=Aneurinibacillus sp. Ricciae_BoGa-3 TaxID=3022697 RepID=UPI002341968E|nr:cupin domain-containing protein [Aneurinibacillus sp. Ricciae_BoGa-3]WCK55651.1 cupin domain-containing protein [Aneurinibacillus sp. Ricciae_BoGa-3]